VVALIPSTQLTRPANPLAHLSPAPLFQAASIVKRTRTLAFLPLDDDWLGLDAEGGRCMSLNHVARRIWMLTEPPATVAHICTQLRREYAVDEATCLSDVLEALQRLAEAGLVAVEPIVEAADA
jgi:hypothetical protein